ncbi:MAG: glutaminyl-peptide cyclotransferase [Fibrobacter sp.]|jgi:glutamine cyclotransferase|nr:glutaminyl-peptide cyclotransferase [Fibrobacter sp.]
MSAVSVFLLATLLQSFSVTDSIPHSSDRYLQGLSYTSAGWIESTGGYGKSKIFKLDFQGNTLDSFALDSRYFGEGSVQLGHEIFWLTWKEGKAFVLDAGTFRLKDSFFIPTEGWGLTVWNSHLLMSNGSAELLILDPRSRTVVSTVKVLDGKNPVKNLNELEAVGDLLYANVWLTDSIAVIELPSGRVRAWLDFSEKARAVRKRNPKAEVLNGIGFDGKNLWITGKNWPEIYKIRFP